ncbi:hypothetical protein FB451DRAFT_1404443 [Mycena latifolia]|nr:hypothetical protein FB451DRAFT_1404443 [Mycena latifolia]
MSTNSIPNKRSNVIDDLAISVDEDAGLGMKKTARKTDSKRNSRVIDDLAISADESTGLGVKKAASKPRQRRKRKVMDDLVLADEEDNVLITIAAGRRTKRRARVVDDLAWSSQDEETDRLLKKARSDTIPKVRLVEDEAVRRTEASTGLSREPKPQSNQARHQMGSTSTVAARHARPQVVSPATTNVTSSAGDCNRVLAKKDELSDLTELTESDVSCDDLCFFCSKPLPVEPSASLTELREKMLAISRADETNRPIWKCQESRYGNFPNRSSSPAASLTTTATVSAPDGGTTQGRRPPTQYDLSAPTPSSSKPVHAATLILTRCHLWPPPSNQDTTDIHPKFDTSRGPHGHFAHFRTPHCILERPVHPLTRAALGDTLAALGDALAALGATTFST